MSLFKRKLSDVFKYEKAFKENERDVLTKYFRDEMIHVNFTYPPAKEIELKDMYEIVRRKQPPKTPAEEKMLKQALGTSYREKWNPIMTYGAFLAVRDVYGEEKFEGKLREAYNRAVSNKTELVDEVMLGLCTPAERENSIIEAKEYGIPLWETADLNRKYKQMSEGLKKEVYNIAKKTKVSPTDVVKELIKRGKK